MGHRGVLWAATLDRHGLPDFTDPHWDPLYAAAQDLGMSMNFHVGVGDTGEEIEAAMKAYRQEYDPAAIRALVDDVLHRKRPDDRQPPDQRAVRPVSDGSTSCRSRAGSATFRSSWTPSTGSG